MWSTILLFIRRHILKGKLSKLDKKAVLIGKDGDNKDVKKVKKQIKLLNYSIAISVLIFLLVIVIVCMMAIYITIMLGTLSGNSVLKDDFEQSEDKGEDGEWQWNTTTPGIQNGMLDISGGIYPTDSVLKNRVIILKIIEESATRAEASTGIWIEPAYMLGAIFRESSNTIYDLADSNTDKNILIDLLYKNPVCGKGSCNYVKNGHSHFVGGSVVNGVDTGDPYTDTINTDSSLYNSMGGNHAIGILQFEIPYYEANFHGNFPVGEVFGIDESQLNFVRPSGFYMPDVIYGSTFRHASVPYSKSSDYNQIVTSSDFTSLSKRNQSFIRFMYAEAEYRRGSVTSDDDAMVYELIELVKSGKVENLDEMLMGNEGSFYNSTGYKVAGSVDTAISIIKQNYGIDIDSDSISWSGVAAGCIGRIVYDEMVKAVNAAEKEEITGGSSGSVTTIPIVPGSNQIDYVGSGKYTPISGLENYYSQSMGCTIYKQSKSNGRDELEKSWNAIGFTNTNTGGQTTMGGAGCGIFSESFIISNLLGQAITPGVVATDYKSGKITGSTGTIPLMNSHIDDIAKYYGLACISFSTRTTAEEFEKRVLEELKKGNMMMSVWTDQNDGKFPWYKSSAGNGSHFMVIRGYNNTTNQLRVYTSSSGQNNGAWTTFEQAGLVELPAATVHKYLSTRSGTEMFSIGFPENIG